MAITMNPTKPVSPAAPRRVAPPLHERVAAARKIGAFDFKREMPDGSLLFIYCKVGEPAHELYVRDSKPVRCACEDFRFRARTHPGHECKHFLLYRQQEEADALIEDAARAAAAWERAWAWHEIGRISDEECNDAFARLEAARTAMRKVVRP